MIGRTPEYLNKKIEGREMKLAALCLIIHPLLILGFSALAVACQSGLEGITNPGFHGLTQVLYEFPVCEIWFCPFRVISVLCRCIIRCRTAFTSASAQPPKAEKKCAMYRSYAVP
mgnify:CR=1 FL=1